MILTYVCPLEQGSFYEHKVQYPDGTYGTRMSDGFVYKNLNSRLDADHDIVEIWPAVSKPVVKGSTVRYQDGYYCVSSITKATCNLTGVFHRHRVIHKRVPLREVYEAHDEWYEKWAQSETYMSM